MSFLLSKISIASPFFLVLSLLSNNINAEIFQWVDNKGQTHFSDREPEHINASNISEQVKQINITNNFSSPEMMLRHQQAKDAEKEKTKQTIKERRKKQATQEKKCKDAKNRLKKVKGRVVFLDDFGKEIKVSEKERKKRAARLENSIRQYCQP